MKKTSKKKTLKRVLRRGSKSASYCCEAAGSVDASILPKEKAFNIIS